jgi:hypothetical protein
MAVQSPLMALLGGILNPTEPAPTPVTEKIEEKTEDQTEGKTAAHTVEKTAALEPEPEPEPEPGTPRSSATKIYVETRVERTIPMHPGVPRACAPPLSFAQT